jgi:hypothetical protein
MPEYRVNLIDRTVHDQERQFEKKLQLARHLVQALCEAGYSCELADEGTPTFPTVTLQ